MGNPIPVAVRAAVNRRSQGRCERCGGPGREQHHRMRRREGGHGVENIVSLCGSCHKHVHSEVTEARAEGFIIGTWVPVEEIAGVPLRTYRGWTTVTAAGNYGERISTN